MSSSYPNAPKHLKKKFVSTSIITIILPSERANNRDLQLNLQIYIFKR